MRESDRKFLEHETEIRWTCDPSELGYVRERWARAGTRTRSVPWDGDGQGAGRKVGEAVLEPDAPNHTPGVFRRRVFVLCDHDRDEPGPGPYDEGTCPWEGVDPSTVEPGKRGEQTPSAWE